ncbi:MAG: hypothetical protein IPL10_12240 [Bacteroidetes bacterium]|nr:hypothetical protein [Bacteroidota bacterium]
MKNINSLDLCNLLIEKNKFFTDALLARVNEYNNNDTSNLAWPDYGQSTFDAMLQYSPVLDIEITKRRDSSDKIVRYLHFIKNACKKYRYKANLNNQFAEAFRYQSVIDDMIDPLLDICCDIFYESSTQSSEKSTIIINEKPIKSGMADISNKVPEPVHPIFKQITCNATAEEIDYFFLILSKEINPATGEPYMKEKDIRHFTAHNFTACGQPDKQRFFDLGTEVKSTITYFVYQFYLKYDNGNISNKMKYVYLLISNFKIFEEDNPKSLLSNMTPSKYPKNKNNVINTEKYFPKNK